MVVLVGRHLGMVAVLPCNKQVQNSRGMAASEVSRAKSTWDDDMLTDCRDVWSRQFEQMSEKCSYLAASHMSMKSRVVDLQTIEKRVPRC